MRFSFSPGLPSIFICERQRFTLWHTRNVYNLVIFYTRWKFSALLSDTRVEQPSPALLHALILFISFIFILALLYRRAVGEILCASEMVLFDIKENRIYYYYCY